MNELLAFSIISFFLVLSPGPNSILILKTVSARGKRAGFENIVGLVIATFLHGAISLLGCKMEVSSGSSSPSAAIPLRSGPTARPYPP